MKLIPPCSSDTQPWAAFSAFRAGLKLACIVGAGVAVVGALIAFRLVPGRATAEGPIMVADDADPVDTIAVDA